ncbi:MAG: VCBS repeat-containing protein [Planctomycetes bacterium]|nr:VCBS repeat-containing protein [Planctomycetota bacterium]
MDYLRDAFSLVRALGRASLIGLILLGTTATQAQDLPVVTGKLLASSEDIEHCSTMVAPPAGGAPRLILQSGHEIRVIELADAPQVLAEAVLPSRSYVWDTADLEDGPALLVMSKEGLLGRHLLAKDASWQTLAAADGLFRGRLTSAPLRHRLARSHGALGLDIVRPTETALGVTRWSKEGASQLALHPTTVRSDQNLGWGLGYTMTSRLSVPYFEFAQRGLLFRRDTDLMLADLDQGGEPALWGRVPRDRDNKIFKFKIWVSDMISDWDGDGASDLLYCDPGDGLVLCYRGKGRPGAEKPGPDQAIRISGYVLWRWLIDVDGDGRKDLLILRIPSLNLLGQLQVVTQGKLPTTLEVRRQKEDGSFEESVTWSEAMAMPVEVSLTRSQRRIRYRAPLTPFLSGKELWLVGPEDAGGVSVRRRGAGGFETVCTLRGVGRKDEICEAPFETAVAIDAQGVARDLIIRRHSSTTGLTSVESFRLPR